MDYTQVTKKDGINKVDCPFVAVVFSFEGNMNDIG